MSRPSKHMDWGVKPYNDGSGFEYEVKVTSSESGARIEIKSPGDSGVVIAVDDWFQVRDQIDRLLDFLKLDNNEGAQ